MNQCSACQVDFFHNPTVRVLFSSTCDHRVCEGCIKRLFREAREVPCPACDVTVKAEDFVEHSRESFQVESEIKVRRKILAIYCKTQADFTSSEEYNDYLEKREE